MNIDSRSYGHYLFETYAKALKSRDLIRGFLPNSDEADDDPTYQELVPLYSFAQIAIEFLDNPVIREFYLAPAEDADETDALNATLVQVFDDALQAIRARIASQTNLSDYNYQLHQCTEQIAAALRRLKRQEKNRPDQNLSPIENVLTYTKRRFQEFLSDLYYRESLERAERIGLVSDSVSSSAQTAIQAADSAQQAAGLAADATMSEHFETLGSNEKLEADKYRTWTLRCMALGGALAGLFLIGPSFGWSAFNIAADDYVHLVQRVLLVAGVFAFAGYLGRQAHNHRTQANWARTLAVQLKTFDAYLAPIKSGEAQSVLRAQFATRVFGDQPGIKGESPPDNGEAVIGKLTELASKLTPGDK